MLKTLFPTVASSPGGLCSGDHAHRFTVVQGQPHHLHVLAQHLWKVKIVFIILKLAENWFQNILLVLTLMHSVGSQPRTHLIIFHLVQTEYKHTSYKYIYQGLVQWQKVNQNGETSMLWWVCNIGFLWTSMKQCAYRKTVVSEGMLVNLNTNRLA